MSCVQLVKAIMCAVLDRAHFVERVLGRDELRARGARCSSGRDNVSVVGSVLVLGSGGASDSVPATTWWTSLLVQKSQAPTVVPRTGEVPQTQFIVSVVVILVEIQIQVVILVETTGR